MATPLVVGEARAVRACRHAVRCAGGSGEGFPVSRTPRALGQAPAPWGAARRSVTGDACRIDVWLWRARFFKTRSLAARIVEDGGVRLARGAFRSPIDKPSRSLRPGDVVSFAQGARWLAVKVEALGERRGPAPEAQGLYSVVDGPGVG